MVGRMWTWMGTEPGLRTGLVLGALLTLIGSWALGGTGVGAPAGSAAEAGLESLAALAFVLVSAGLLLWAVRAEEKRIATRHARNSR